MKNGLVYHESAIEAIKNLEIELCRDDTGRVVPCVRYNDAINAVTELTEVETEQE